MISLIIATIQIETQTLTKIENKHTIWQASINNYLFQVTTNKINMPFNSKTASNAGKISKRGKSLNIDLRNDLKRPWLQYIKLITKTKANIYSLKALIA